MRPVEIDGKLYRRWEVDEIGPGPDKALNTPLWKLFALLRLANLLASYPTMGPLMAACVRDAEHLHRGGGRA